jgi:UDP-3-O-[3-hydroxymyristoyl] glucosamine N-acyltransferase
MKEKLILIGGGGHCKSCIDVIEQEGSYEIMGILDIPEKIGMSVFGYGVIGSDDQITELSKNCRNFFITIGQIGAPGTRKKIFKTLKELDLNLPVIISPRAYVSPHSTIMEGTIVMHHAMINAGAMIGANCLFWAAGP